MQFLHSNVVLVAPTNDPNATVSIQLRSEDKLDSNFDFDTRGIGTLFEPLLDDASRALSCTTEGDVSSSAQSSIRNERRRRGDKETGQPEVLDDRTYAVSNHLFAHWHPTLVEMNASTPLQGADDLADSTWLKVRSIDEEHGMEHSSSRTGVGAGAMFRRWLDATRPDDPFCCWTVRTKQIGLNSC